MKIFEHDFLINFDNIKKDGKLSEISLLNFLINIAGMHSDTVGYGLKDIPKTDITFLLIAWKVKIFERPSCLEKIHIKTWANAFYKVTCTREFEVYNQEGKLIAIASTKWAMIKVSTHTLTKIDHEIMDAYQNIDKKVFQGEIEKLSEPEKIDNSFSYKIQRRDIDTNNHVNNLKYLEIGMESIPEEIYENFSYTNLEVMYKNECKLGYEIICNFSKISEDESYVVIRSKDLSKLHCIIKFSK